MTTTTFTRRGFLHAVTGLGAGLVLGFRWPLSGDFVEAADSAVPVPLNAFLSIGADDVVTVLVSQAEMGQGVYTALPMMVAEELEVDWSKVRVQAAPAGAAYVNPAMGQQATGGSTSVRMLLAPMRKAGAAAREMLIAAAAASWGVEAATCRAQAGTVRHEASGRALRYGELAEAAAKIPPPQDPPLDDPKSWTILGTPRPRLDTPVKVDGTAVFGLDVQVPGMKVATVLRCPAFRGTLVRLDDAAARAIPGVTHVLRTQGSVAVVADGYGNAKRGLDALTVEWDAGSMAEVSSASIREAALALAARPGRPARTVGNAADALAGAAKRLEALYEVPFLHHATMEPMNATAHVRADGCDVWAPTQAQTRVQMTAAEMTGLKPEQVRVHTTYLGGGFGRRFEVDFIADAVRISKEIGAPVKVIWSREEDVRHGYYRPATVNRLEAGLGPDGSPVAWSHRMVGPSIMQRAFPMAIRDGIDPTSVEGAANLPYAIPNLSVQYTLQETGIPVGFWRSVGSSQNAYVTECFLDELATAAGKDPFEFRRALLAESPRHRRVLELAAEKAGWGTAPPPGRFRGIAVAESFGTWVAQVAEVSVDDAGAVRVHRVVCAVDSGIVLNPDTVVAQMESGIVFGLTAALKGEITIDQGRVLQGNFDDYPLLRIDEMPAIEVHLAPSGGAPGGVGEPGTPPIAPAVVNAIAAATGKRIRQLPISRHSLKKE